MQRSMLLALLGASLFAPVSAFAQGLDDLDGRGDETVEDDRSSRADRARADEVKEVTKGWYAKTNVGGAGYLGKFRGFVSAGTAVGLSVGQDFLDQEKMSAAWEVGLMQGIHNGCHYELQADYACAGNAFQESPYIQGDLRTYSLTAALEFSGYPRRRIGIGGRVDGGVLLSPLLMEESQYYNEVVATWGGIDPNYHHKPHPVVGGGPTIEYYSKLAHFSVGADADVFYAIGFDLGFNVSGYFKYTF